VGQSALKLRGDGDSVSLRGTKVVFKVRSDQTDGASCTEWVTAPGFDTGLHVHERLEETWYVLEGELTFQVGQETFRATPGSCVFVPPRTPHAFANQTNVPAKFLLMMSPASHDCYFIELADILTRSGPPDSDAIAALRVKYDTQQLSSLTTGPAPQPATG
jgi:mannose-6-phosphate isomerase-like protein (cupin superfamily)